tara:strand:- start:283 stop:825 length:543 start_codon:yes stop_codon:yes gene_type:complete
MSYNSRNPTIAFRVTSYEKGKLEKESSKEKLDVANYCKSIIHQYLAGDIIKNEKSIDQELQKARLEKLKLENKLTQLKIDYFENFGTPLNPSSTRIISRKLLHQNLVSGKVQDQSQSPYDESNKRLKCVNCNQLFEWINQSGFIDQIAEYSNHTKISHNRELNALEKDVIDNLEFQGASS